MKKKHEFSKGIRGKYLRSYADMSLPVCLDGEVQGYLRKRANAKGIEVNQLVNELLRRDIEMIESAC